MTMVRAVLLSWIGYVLFFRPRLLHWGATAEEIRAEFPGRELVPGGTRTATMAVTLNAPPSRVWPWLVQMGYGRAGWYSWDRLDNWGQKSSDRIHREWQQIALHDRLPSMPDNKAWWEVAALDPHRYLGLRTSLRLSGKPFDPSSERPRFYTDSIWGFLLNETAEGRTRLVVSGYWSLRPRWLRWVFSLLFLEPSHWLMQTRQFHNLKRLVSRERRESQDDNGPSPHHSNEPYVTR